jgi:hypothetical protein
VPVAHNYSWTELQSDGDSGIQTSSRMNGKVSREEQRNSDYELAQERIWSKVGWIMHHNKDCADEYESSERLRENIAHKLSATNISVVRPIYLASTEPWKSASDSCSNDLSQPVNEEISKVNRSWLLAEYSEADSRVDMPASEWCTDHNTSQQWNSYKGITEYRFAWIRNSESQHERRKPLKYEGLLGFAEFHHGFEN